MKNEKNSKVLTQHGALPYRRTQDGEVEVMLVTSRETRRWVIPKGWPIKKLKPFATAAREAYEEAGLGGAISRESLGSFTYQKRLKTRKYVACEVDVYAMEVSKEAKRWPERDERERRWFEPEVAARHVTEPELADIILQLPRRLANGMMQSGRQLSGNWNLSQPASGQKRSK
ncbi:MAG TPA: NUDIX hydrolase [Saliniramus sp.]|nr:NUDIX hydrolase [Saliniramus sp.]